MGNNLISMNYLCSLLCNVLIIINVDLPDGISAADRILLHKFKKDTKEQSTQIVKLTDMLAVAVRETIPPPQCTQWEFVKVIFKVSHS